MAKVILEFDPIEEAEEARTALNAMLWKISMIDLDQKLRNTTKYNQSILNQDQEASEIEFKVAEKYRELINDILYGYGLTKEMQ
jgi:hypothetical protein